ANIPHLASIDPLRTRHPAVAYQFIKLGGRNADVRCGFVARKAAARDGPDIGQGDRARDGDNLMSHRGRCLPARAAISMYGISSIVVCGSGHREDSGWFDPVDSLPRGQHRCRGGSVIIRRLAGFVLGGHNHTWSARDIKKNLWRAMEGGPTR